MHELECGLNQDLHRTGILNPPLVHVESQLRVRITTSLNVANTLYNVMFYIP